MSHLHTHSQFSDSILRLSSFLVPTFAAFCEFGLYKWHYYYYYYYYYLDILI